MSIFRNKAKERAIREGKYRQIVELLSEEFDWDDVVEESCLSVLMRRDGNFDQSFEYIVDQPMLAQFRLKHYDGHFLVSYYPFSFINDDKEERARRLTRQIREIEDA